ncbi:MAG: sugar ABC transporter permease [Alphaproteobacteria bacterium]
MRRHRNRWTGMLYVAPALLFVAVFVLWPLGRLIWLSFTAKSLMSGPDTPVDFVGLENYARAFGDKNFWRAMTFTLAYTAYITPILLVLNLALALLVSKNTPPRRATRTVVFLPVVIGLASSSLLWYWLFDQQVGPFNRLLVDMGILEEPLVLFKKATTGQFAVIISVVWKVVGFGMILMVADIQAIGDDVIAAAMIDGASPWKRVRRIIIPLAMRSIVLATLISAIGSMLAFDQFYLMSGGGPRGQTFTTVYWIYQSSFVRFELGYGAAQAVLLMVVITSGTAVQLWLSRKGQK